MYSGEGAQEEDYKNYIGNEKTNNEIKYKQSNQNI